MLGKAGSKNLAMRHSDLFIFPRANFQPRKAVESVWTNKEYKNILLRD